MPELSKPLLMLIACLSFGLTGVLLALWLGRSIRAASANLPPAPPSERRLALRQRALRESTLLAMVLPLVGAVAPAFRHKRFEGLRAYLGIPYIKAGYPGGLDESELLSLAALTGVVTAVLLGLCCAAVFGLWGIVMGLLGLPLGLLMVVASLKTKADLRRKQITGILPYALDLLVLVLKAGTSVGLALERVVQDYAEHPIGDELGQVLAEMQLGASRREAFERLSARLELEDVQALADNIMQAEELGWPLADTLARLAERLNTRRIMRAEEFAGTASVMVMLPSTLVLISVILLLFGPLIVRLLRGELTLG